MITRSYARSRSPRLAGNGFRCRRCAWAMAWPSLRTRRHAAPIGPYVEPQPSTSTRALPDGSSTTRSGTLMPSILAWRNRTMWSWLAGSYEMEPLPSCFSRPPIRCWRPGVPGMAHSRASVSGSRTYGQNSPDPSVAFGFDANSTLRAGSWETSGPSHGSEPLATEPSDSNNTGVRYVSAIRTASSAASKQSAGDCGATTGTGDSPLRPYNAWSRSACSVLVGRPVDGPPRCTSMTTSGSSVITARPIVSDFSARPGPEVEVTPSAPP